MESDQGYEKKREARNDSRSFVLTNWNNGGAVDREEEGRRKQPGVCVGEGEDAPELVVCEVPEDIQVGMLSMQLEELEMER